MFIASKVCVENRDYHQKDVGIIINSNAIAAIRHNHVNGMCDVLITGRTDPIYVLSTFTELHSKWKRLKFTNQEHDYTMILEGMPDKLCRREVHATKASRIACIVEGYNPELTHIYLLGYEPMIVVNTNFDNVMRHWWQSAYDTSIEIFIKKPLPISKDF